MAIFSAQGLYGLRNRRENKSNHNKNNTLFQVLLHSSQQYFQVILLLPPF